MIRIKFIMHYSNLVQEICRMGKWSLEDAYIGNGIRHGAIEISDIEA